MAALRRFVGVGLQSAARACRCLSTSASDGATLLQSWTQSPLALTMQPRDVQNVEPSGTRAAGSLRREETGVPAGAPYRLYRMHGFDIGAFPKRTI